MLMKTSENAGVDRHLKAFRVRIASGSFVLPRIYGTTKTFEVKYYKIVPNSQYDTRRQEQ
jgi:hypothetical protein